MGTENSESAGLIKRGVGLVRTVGDDRASNRTRIGAATTLALAAGVPVASSVVGIDIVSRVDPGVFSSPIAETAWITAASAGGGVALASGIAAIAVHNTYRSKQDPYRETTRTMFRNMRTGSVLLGGVSAVIGGGFLIGEIAAPGLAGAAHVFECIAASAAVTAGATHVGKRAWDRNLPRPRPALGE